jgi:hypothetical protein
MAANTASRDGSGIGRSWPLRDAMKMAMKPAKERGTTNAIPARFAKAA